jgi:hypothetical protein
VKEDGMNVYTLEGCLAKIEKERGATDAEDPFNEILRRVGEPPCANASEAFGRRAQADADARLERSAPRGPDFSTDPHLVLAERTCDEGILDRIG